MTRPVKVIHAALLQRRWAHWRIVVPGVGVTTVRVRSRAERAARELITAKTGQAPASVIVLSDDPDRPGRRWATHPRD